MSSSNVTMRARVEIEITVGTWGDDINLRDMRAQIRREAEQTIRGKLGSDGVRIIGVPTVTAIMVEDKAHG